MTHEDSSKKSGKRRKLGGIQDLKTSMSNRVRSKPEVEGQEYLDLYTLNRDRARWGCLKSQSEGIIQGIDREIQKLRAVEKDNEAPQDGEQDPKSPPKRPGENFGIFKVDYRPQTGKRRP